jgi:hypothetical protein
MEQNNFFAKKAFMFTFKIASLFFRDPAFQRDTFFEREEVNKKRESVCSSNFSPIGLECFDLREPGTWDASFPFLMTVTQAWGRGCCRLGKQATGDTSTV